MFIRVEVKQLIQEKHNYFLDHWNVIDMISLVLVAYYVIMASTHSEDWELHSLAPLVGSSTCFLLWIKVFYWMRLFKPFASFIRAITQIIADSMVFMFMLFLCLAAFSNILIILQSNREENSIEGVYDDALNNTIMSSLLNSYLTGLGEFQYDNYSEDHEYFTWGAFILATFVIQLIFMNMLIAIMGETFSRISETQDQATMREVASMISSYFYLLDIKEIYKHERYILWLTFDKPEDDEDEAG